MINIARPQMGDEEKAAVMAVLESGQLAQGSVVARLRGRLRRYCGAKHGIATSNGTTALHLAVLAHEIGPGDEVITARSPLSPPPTPSLYAGARPVFVDIDPDSYNIDVDANRSRHHTPHQGHYAGPSLWQPGRHAAHSRDSQQARPRHNRGRSPGPRSRHRRVSAPEAGAQAASPSTPPRTSPPAKAA